MDTYHKYVVVFNTNIDDTQESDENVIPPSPHSAKFFNSLRILGREFNLDYSTISKRLKNTNSTYMQNNNVLIIKL